MKCLPPKFGKIRGSKRAIKLMKKGRKRVRRTSFRDVDKIVEAFSECGGTEILRLLRKV